MPRRKKPVLRAPSFSLARSTAQYDPVVPSAPEAPEWNRLDSLWRHALLSPHAHSSRIRVSGDGCAVWQGARDAQRTLWPFHLTSLLQRRERQKDDLWGRCASGQPEY
jgi:hypothetical protein